MTRHNSASGCSGNLTRPPSRQPRTNACRKWCQTLLLGRGSVRVGSGSRKHAICMALCPAELVVNGLPSAIGSPHNSQHSVEVLSGAVVNSAVGTCQLWVGPRRVRHSKPGFLVAALVAIAKPPLLKLQACVGSDCKAISKALRLV